jgi:hypothetical protein
MQCDTIANAQPISFSILAANGDGYPQRVLNPKEIMNIMQQDNFLEKFSKSLDKPLKL